MKKIILILLLLIINVCFSQTKNDSISIINKAIEIEKRVEQKGNSNSVEEIKTAINELNSLVPLYKSKKGIANLKYLRGMTAFSFFRFSFVGDKLSKSEHIEICKNVISDLEFADSNGYDTDDSVYIVLKQARKELKLLQEN